MPPMKYCVHLVVYWISTEIWAGVATVTQ